MLVGNSFRKNIPCGVGFFVLLAGVMGYGHAEPVDCDGLTITDSLEIDPSLQWRMDAAADEKLFDISIGFQYKEPDMPDSCRQVQCPDVDYTFLGRLYKLWSERLFTDYELFGRADTLHRLTPETGGPGPDYNYLWARKATILALSKECFVDQLGNSVIIVPIRHQAGYVPREASRRKVDALGRRSDPRRIPSGGIMSTPSFLPR